MWIGRILTTLKEMDFYHPSRNCWSSLNLAASNEISYLTVHIWSNFVRNEERSWRVHQPPFLLYFPFCAHRTRTMCVWQNTFSIQLTVWVSHLDDAVKPSEWKNGRIEVTKFSKSWIAASSLTFYSYFFMRIRVQTHSTSHCYFLIIFTFRFWKPLIRSL